MEKRDSADLSNDGLETRIFVFCTDKYVHVFEEQVDA